MVTTVTSGGKKKKGKKIKPFREAKGERGASPAFPKMCFTFVLAPRREENESALFLLEPSQGVTV